MFCEKDDREEAAEYDSHAVGVFKTDETLVGHIPIELSRLIDYFLKSSTENNVSAMVTGKRKRELGLVVPAKYTAFTKETFGNGFTRRTPEKTHQVRTF